MSKEKLFPLAKEGEKYGKFIRQKFLCHNERKI